MVRERIELPMSEDGWVTASGNTLFHTHRDPWEKSNSHPQGENLES